MRYRALVVACAAGCAVASLTASSAEAAGALQFRRIQYDSPGKDDRSNASLNAEFFTIKNTGEKRRNLRGFSVHDRTGYTYTFEDDCYLDEGESVRVHTGRGDDTHHHKYWGRRAYVWNNDGDTAWLLDREGDLRDTCTWPDGDGDIVC